MEGTTSKIRRVILKTPKYSEIIFDRIKKTNIKDVNSSFLNEIDFFCKSQKHPNIVEFYGRCGDGIVLEYIDGYTLLHESILNSPLKEKYLWTSQMRDALLYIHSLGVSHGDFTPNNIMVNNSRSIKVIDFGRSIAEGILPLPTQRLFMSPEHISGKSRSGIACDIYSYGIVVKGLFLGSYEELDTNREDYPKDIKEISDRCMESEEIRVRYF
ncbi:kinase-like domain-containing protein [Coemansia mojavensis]|nr:kinase-like domain-containing protein [Coemansia mojavensis]